MKYEQPPAGVTRAEAEALAGSRDNEALASALVSIALNESDGAWATNFCLRFVSAPAEAVRGSALLGLGHLARRFRAFESGAAVAQALQNGLQDSSAWVRGQADAASDDFEQFVGPLRR